MAETPEDIQKLLKKVCDHFDQEDRSVRQSQIRVWRKQKLMWDGFSRLYYSDVAKDWRVWDGSQASGGDDNYQDYYDKPVNVYRAYLESIIAALSVIVPPIKCYPDDADNNLDIQTAKAGDKIAELVFRHNDAPLLWLHALFVLCTEGMVACYSYPKSDESYGTYKKEEYGEVEEQEQFYTCPTCGMELETDEAADEQTEAIKDEYNPEDVQLQNVVVNEGIELCPNCASMIEPSLQTRPIIATRLVGITTEPKTRICLEAYGGLYVKVPNYAARQADMPYLEYLYETNIVNVFERYPDLYKKFGGSPEKFKSSAGAYDTYEQWARLSPQYRNEVPRDTVTVRNFWLRPSAFNYCSEDESKELKKLYPNGARVVFINEEFAEAENEALDDCWTVTQNPLSDYIHFDPYGVLLTSVQELTNDIISLTTQTIEQGVGQTFADQSVVNFDQYGQREVLPGSINPVKVPSGRSLGEFFYEVKTANLSGEILPFLERLQQLGQLSSGALPSLFGGQMTESRTASEYSMSRNQASQRLQTTWKMMTFWWKNIFGKVIPMYIKEMETDEREVRKDESGNFINVFIRKAELEGKIGRVELEANENLPMTWNQRKDAIMNLIELGNPEILAYLGHPDNLPFVHEAIGLGEFDIIGTEERDGEYEEIKLLMESAPIILPPDENAMMQAAMSGDPMAMQKASQPREMPSIEVDVDFQNHNLRLEIDKKWINSEEGRMAKVEKPDGYKNVLLHAKQHMDVIQMLMMQQAMSQMQQPDQSQGGGPGNKPGSNSGGGKPSKPGENTKTPIKGDSDVRTS